MVIPTSCWSSLLLDRDRYRGPRLTELLHPPRYFSAAEAAVKAAVASHDPNILDHLYLGRPSGREGDTHPRRSPAPRAPPRRPSPTSGINRPTTHPAPVTAPARAGPIIVSRPTLLGTGAIWRSHKILLRTSARHRQRRLQRMPQASASSWRTRARMRHQALAATSK